MNRETAILKACLGKYVQFGLHLAYADDTGESLWLLDGNKRIAFFLDAAKTTEAQVRGAAQVYLMQKGVLIEHY